MIFSNYLTQLSLVLNTETLVFHSGLFHEADDYTPSSFTIQLHKSIPALGYCQILASAIGSNANAVAKFC